MSGNHDYGSGYFDDSAQKRSFTLDLGLAGVFGLMFLGLVASGVAAWLTLNFAPLYNLVYGTQAVFLVVLFLPVGLVMLAFPRIWRMKPAAAVLLFFVYALLNGVTLSFIFLVYNMGAIMLAFLSAAGMFGVMALFGAFTKSDLSGTRNFLLMGLFGIIIASVLNFFLANTMLDMVISYVGIAVFLGLTAYHVQNIKRQMEMHAGRAPAAAMVSGALHLYLSFMNIFLLLLRMTNRRR